MNNYKKYDVVALGEAILDFVPSSDYIGGTYQASVGGAPLNVAFSLSKLVKRVAMITRIGSDPIGDYILNEMKNSGLDISYVQRDTHRNTPITIVMPEKITSTRFVIYREGGSDTAIDFTEIPKEVFANTHIFHIGTLTMSSSISAMATRQSAINAQKNGAIISLDVNLRPGVWKSKNEMIESTWELINFANIVKMTSDEAEYINLSLDNPVIQKKLLLITNGDKSTRLFTKDYSLELPAYKVRVVDTTGAGDSFMAAFLYKYLELIKKDEGVVNEQLRKCLEVAIYAGALSVQKVGGTINSLTKEDLINI